MSQDQSITYRFHFASSCVMCGAGKEQHRVIGRRLDRSQGWRPGRLPGAATTVLRCHVCGLVFANPLPLPDTVQDHYGVVPEQYFGPERVKAQDQLFSGEIRCARELLSHGEGGTALDVGAGAGRVMNALREAGFDVWGIEPSPSFRGTALATYSLDPDRLRLCAIEDTWFPAESFDFITFSAVLEHLANPSVALERALAWLRPGGVIHAEVPSSDWLVGRLLNLYYRLIGSGLVTNLSPMHPPYHLYEFSIESFRRHGERIGYEVVRTQRFAGDPFVRGIPGRILRRLMVATGTEMQLVVWLRAS